MIKITICIGFGVLGVLAAISLIVFGFRKGWNQSDRMNLSHLFTKSKNVQQSNGKELVAEGTIAFVISGALLVYGVNLLMK